MATVNNHGEHTSLLVIAFKKDRVQKDGASHQKGLFLDRTLVGEADFKGVGVGKQLGAQALGLFQNLAELGSVLPVGVLFVGIKDPKGHFATTLTTRVTFRGAIEAHTAAAGGRMNLVHFLFAFENGKSRDAVVAFK